MKLIVSINYEIQTENGPEERILSQEHTADSTDKAKQLTVLALTAQHPEAIIKEITTNESV